VTEDVGDPLGVRVSEGVGEGDSEMDSVGVRLTDSDVVADLDPVVDGVEEPDDELETVAV
jgi:hypothetical protein